MDNLAALCLDSKEEFEGPKSLSRRGTEPLDRTSREKHETSVPFEDVGAGGGIAPKELLHIIQRNAGVSVKEHHDGKACSLNPDANRLTGIAQVNNDLLMRSSASYRAGAIRASIEYQD